MNLTEPDDLSYLRFTGPQRRDKALSTLQGMLDGFAIDGAISPRETDELRGWANDHRTLDRSLTFRELLDAIDRATADGRIDAEEVQDVRWLCANAQSDSHYFNAVTRELQHLQGILHGILTDGRISVEELDGLSRWLESHEFLRSNYPFDEIESLVTTVLKDRTVDAKEHAQLKAFFGQFTNPSVNARIRAMQEPSEAEPIHVGGICAMCPEIEWDDREFCFTGFSNRGTRSVFADAVEARNGRFSDRVTKRLNYLIIGGDGNPCWAFACYGRKVEQAIQLRKSGQHLVIVHENDFWDAI